MYANFKFVEDSNSGWSEDRKSAEAWKQIRWLASYPKSGNTWVRALLDAYYNDKCDINRLSGSCADNSAIWSGRESDEILVDAAPEIRLLARQYGIARLVHTYMSEPRRLPLIVKTHSCCAHVQGQDTLPWILTHSIVYLVRNPCDVLVSLAAHFGKSVNDTLRIMDSDNFMLDGREGGKLPDVVSSWRTNVRSFLDAQKEMRVLIIKYEDLKHNTAGTFAKILNHFQIPVVSDRLANAVKETELAKLQAQECEKGFVERFRDSSDLFFGGKREKINDFQKARLTLSCKDEMIRLGYINTPAKLEKAYGQQK